jgi:outer membrane protein assembly factor BamD (BamD/ComL family)
MLRQNFKLFLLVTFVCCTSLAAVQSEDQILIEELTGNSNKISEVLPQVSAKKMSLAEKHLFAGLDAFKNKNYILALKHYNIVIDKFGHSKDVRNAYIAKSKLYVEMGLREQAQYNSKKAFKLGEKKSK